jgi:hypothetical protein
MKNWKTWLAIGLVAVLTGMAIGYRIQNNNLKRALAAAQVKIDKDNVIITQAKHSESLAQAALKALQQQAAAEREQLQSDAFTANLNAEKLRIQLAKIQSSTPNELGETASSILGVGDIKYNGSYFTVPVETFRLITERLADQRDFTLTREPAYKKTIADWAKLSSIQDSQLAEKDKVIVAQSNEISALNDIKFQLNKELSATRHAAMGLWGKLEWGAIGAGIGFVAGFVDGYKLKK